MRCISLLSLRMELKECCLPPKLVGVIVLWLDERDLSLDDVDNWFLKKSLYVVGLFINDERSLIGCVVHGRKFGKAGGCLKYVLKS